MSDRGVTRGRRGAWIGVLVGCALVSAAPAPAHAQSARPVDRATYEGWLDELSNHGRWGADDQLGTLNLITDETRRAAARLVRSGVSVSLAHELLTVAAEDTDYPFEHEMLLTGATEGVWAVERIAVVFHGYAHSHLDALCHRFHGDGLYNGFTRGDVTSEGCQALAVTAARNGVLTRGVLVDVPRLRGVPWLEPGTAVYAEDLEAWEKRAGLKVGPGDALLLRTGRWALRAERGPVPPEAGAAGLHASAVRWLRERGVALLGSDLGSDVMPSGVEGETHPVHELVLVALGMPILDNLDLEAVGERAEREGRWEFLLTLAPLVIRGGTGSPVNPIATF